MQVQFFCPRWGSEHIAWEKWLQQVKDAGYDGIEWAIANNTASAEIEKVFVLADKHRMPVIAQHYETNASDFQRHYDEYVQWFENIKEYSVLKINSQTGKDYFSFEENKQLIELAGSYANDMNVPIVHETHRGKFSFAAHITKTYLQSIPGLRITLDASHWVCVAESLLDDQEDAMQLAIERTDHIHARIGHPEGPQVIDPRVNVWQPAMQKHLSWWDKVVELKTKSNKSLTISPEFGPFPYMVHDPHSGKPLVNQWEVNLHMLQTLRKRFC